MISMYLSIPGYVESQLHTFQYSVPNQPEYPHVGPKVLWWNLLYSWLISDCYGGYLEGIMLMKSLEDVIFGWSSIKSMTPVTRPAVIIDILVLYYM